jgi:hypothetical protein
MVLTSGVMGAYRICALYMRVTPHSPLIILLTGCSVIWLTHYIWDVGIAGSNPVTLTMRD